MKTGAVFLLFLTAAAGVGQAADPKPHRWGLGVNYTGAHLNYRYGRQMLEARWQTGREGTGDEKITSHIAGLRWYRFLNPKSKQRFYFGFEADHSQSVQETGTLKVSGILLGGFMGLERDMGRRFSVGADVGPYLFAFEEKNTRASSTELEFVANTHVTWRFF